MKILVIGLNPSKRGSKSPTLKTLKIWLDYLDIKYISLTNIYGGYGKFSLKDVQTDQVKEVSKDYNKILALGSKVSNVLDLMGINHFNLPHPSGLNRQLNNSNYIHERLEACKNYLYLECQ